MNRSVLTGDTGAFPLHFNGLHKWNDDYISKLVCRLEELDISREETNHEVQTQIKKQNESLKKDDYCCSSNLVSTSSILKELSSMRPSLLTQRWRDHLRPQFATDEPLHPRWATQQRQDEAIQSAALLRITPAQVSDSQGLKTRWWDKDWMSISDHWGADVALGEFTGSHSNDSDVSDQEKGNTHSHWTSSFQMDLRPEHFDRDQEHIMSREATETQTQVYPEVLPGPLKWLHMSLSLSSSSDEKEGRMWSNLHAQDASISAIVSRLMELERLQAATVLKERVRTGRSRPATAVPVTRCCSRQRKPDPADSRSEFSGRKECRSAVSVSTDVAPSDNASVTHKVTAPGVQSKQRRAKTGPKYRPVPSNRPGSCPERSAEKLVPGLSTGWSTSPKPTSLNKTKQRKAVKKELPKRGHTGSTKGHKSKG